jgi:soluble lytic murein transglycosylase-like protein
MWLLLLVLLAAPPVPCDTELLDAMEWVESRGNPLATSPAGARGLLQILPQWSNYPAWALYIPTINRIEGCRIYQRWLSRAGGSRRAALRAYNGGNAGLRGDCCKQYADAVLGRID